MATAYPSNFPCPLIAGFRIDVGMGVIRADNPGHQVQRRVFTTMPHMLAMSFAMSVVTWAAWQKWCLDNAYGWFEMPLPSLYAGQTGAVEEPTVIRFVSEFTAVNLTEDDVQVSVTAEISPSMFRRVLEAS